MERGEGRRAKSRDISLVGKEEGFKKSSKPPHVTEARLLIEQDNNKQPMNNALRNINLRCTDYYVGA